MRKDVRGNCNVLKFSIISRLNSNKTSLKILTWRWSTKPEQFYSKWLKAKSVSLSLPNFVYQPFVNFNIILNSCFTYYNFYIHTDCGLPKPIANGKSDIVTTEYIYYFGEKIALPQQLEYYCDTSFAFTESSQSFLTCDDSSSSFEPALPTCARGKLSHICCIALRLVLVSFFHN